MKKRRAEVLDAVSKLGTASDNLAWIILVIGGVALVGLTSVSIYQVIVRFVFDNPSTWSEVVARSLMVWSVFLCLPHAVGRGELMAFDFLRRRMRARAALAFHFVVGGATIIVLAVLLVQGIALTQRASTQSLAGLEVIGARVSWVYLAIPVGSGLALLTASVRMIRLLLDPKFEEDSTDLEDAI